MLHDIFQIDWIFVDTIIIILLILLLVSVKIFKSTHRWRSSFTNMSMDTFFISNLQNLVGNKYIRIKKVVLIKNSSLQEKASKNPTIIILRTHHSRRFLKILAEALGSNGFNIVLANFKIRNYLNKNNYTNIVISELKSIISIILDAYEKRGLIINQNYISLSHSASVLLYKAILTDSKNKGLILINPKIDSENLKNFTEINKNKHANIHLYTIFSKYSFFIFSNKNLKFLQTNISSQKLSELKVIILEKAKKSFKYYETIVLGTIINIIENKLVKLNT